MLDDTRTPRTRRGRTFYALRIAAATLLISVLGLALSAGGGAAEEPANEAANEPANISTSTLDGVFTAEQVEGIKSTFSRECASCHGPELGGSGLAPPLKGLPFMFFWEGKSVAELYTFTHDNMPLGNAGSLADETYADLIALILSSNGFPAGGTALEPNVEALADITIAPAPTDGGE